MGGLQQQWKKRVNVFRHIYSDLQQNYTPEEFKKIAFEQLNFENDQMRIVEYYIGHRQELIKIISSKLSTNWQWDRIPPVEQAILFATVSEAKTSKIDRKILIDQALVTTKHFADPESAQYINAILDKVI